jgi:hypothetical protein
MCFFNSLRDYQHSWQGKEESELPADHNDTKGSKRHRSCERMSRSCMLKQEDYLVQTASMRDSTNFCCEVSQTHLGYQLVDKDHDSNGTDKSSQKRSTEDIV